MKAGYVGRSKRAVLDALIAEATVDCYNDSECITGIYTMLVDNLAVPFQTVVLGIGVTVTGVDLTTDGQITAVCTCGKATQRIPVLELSLPTPPPEGAEWIDAYRRWAKEEHDHSGPRSRRRRAPGTTDRARSAGQRAPPCVNCARHHDETCGSDLPGGDRLS
jgi:hypothetical protein